MTEAVNNIISTGVKCCSISQTNISVRLNTSANLNSLFIRAGEFWWISSEVGKEGGKMKAKVGKKEETNVPPIKGWQFAISEGNWRPDPKMECSRQLSEACSEIRVEFRGGLKEKCPDFAGSYLPVEGGEHICGRPVC